MKPQPIQNQVKTFILDLNHSQNHLIRVIGNQSAMILRKKPKAEVCATATSKLNI